MPTVTIRTAIHPSEDPKKVRESLLNMFPDAEVQETALGLEARTQSLAEVRSLIRKQKIMDAARRSLLHSLDASGRRARFHLNKQAGLKGRLSFAEGLTSPLGELEVECEGPGLEDLFKEMAPMTIRGIPVSEERAEEEIAKRRSRKRVVKPDTTSLEDDVDEELAAATGEDERGDEE